MKSPAMKKVAIILLPLLILTIAPLVRADEPEKPHAIAIAGDTFKLYAPAAWVTKKPRTMIVEHEFAVPAAKGDELDGRVTMMSAGGGVEANVQRWYDQFKQPDGGSTKERAKVKQLDIAGQKVTLVDIAGTYNDKPAPMAPGVERANYRMLGAIVVTKKSGNYFIKFYGPQKTVTDHEAGFVKMLDSLKPN
jgi:hypothetical protein